MHTPSSSPKPKRNWLLAIDPSLRSLGAAICTFQGERKAIVLENLICLHQHSGSEIPYHVRAFAMAQEVARWVSNQVIFDLDVLVEAPENWHGEKGIGSKDTGAVQTLYFTVGCVVASLARTPGIRSIHIVGPSQWKGNAGKDIMVKRAHKWAAALSTMLPDNCPHDTCEALLLNKYGIQMWDAETETFAAPIVEVWRRERIFSSLSFSYDLFVDESEAGNAD